jgi:hypothetical protein
MPTIYNFEAKSIQNYILDSSKLKDMIGASEQIEYLCCENGLLDKVLSSIKNANTQFVRKAGGAFTIIFSKLDDAKRFQAVWTFCVQQAFPGLNFVQGIGEDKDWKQAIEFADKEFKKDDHNHLLLTFPLAGALVARSPRTGQPAVSQSKKLGERLDAITKHKREFRKNKLLIDKLKFDTPVDWPINLKNKDKEDEDETCFPLLKDNNYIGIIHADGNNLGQLLKALKKQLRENTQLTESDYVERLMAFSKAIETANIKSARKAIKNEKIVKAASNHFRTMPARPLVLGGDDMTFIVRGDLSLDFTKRFLEEFEKRTETEFKSLTDKYSDLKKCLPEKLTACAGIAYIKASQPFYQGYKLAESLCQYAKRFSNKRLSKDKLMPSSLAFRRITTSIINSYETILEDELIIGNEIQITMQPYFVGEVKPSHANDYVELKNLQELSQLLKDNEVSQGIFREFLSLLEIDRNLAEQAMRRWYDNMEKRQQQGLLTQLKEIFEKMGFDKQVPNSLKLIGSKIEKYERTPIGDALALVKVG